MKSLYVLAAFSFISVACSRMSEEDLYKMAQETYQQKNYPEAVKHLEELVDRYPNGMHTEESFFLLGTIYNDTNQDYGKAIGAFKLLREHFPRGQRAPTALFLVGFIYNNQLQNYDSARIAYEQFLQEFPDHEMAASARFELENLGKSPDETFRTKVASKEERKEKGMAGPRKRKK